jgi:hypothetical protein
MPGLVRGVARTAVVAGTATAVSGRVQRRQAERYAERDAAIWNQQDQAYQQQAAAQYAPPPPQYAPPPPAYPASGGGEDTIAQLQKLSEMRAQGLLTDAEFAAAKAKILSP